MVESRDNRQRTSVAGCPYGCGRGGILTSHLMAISPAIPFFGLIKFLYFAKGFSKLLEQDYRRVIGHV